MNRRVIMMREFERWRELAFVLWFLWPLEAWMDPSTTTVLRKPANMLAAW